MITKYLDDKFTFIVATVIGSMVIALIILFTLMQRNAAIMAAMSNL